MLPSSSIPCMPLNQLGESSSSAELPILGVPQQHEQSTESTQTVHADKKESMPLLICNVCGKVHILYLLKLHFVMSSIFRIISLSTGKISKQVFAKKFNLIQHQRVHTGQTPPPPSLFLMKCITHSGYGCSRRAAFRVRRTYVRETILPE